MKNRFIFKVSMFFVSLNGSRFHSAGFSTRGTRLNLLVLKFILFSRPRFQISFLNILIFALSEVTLSLTSLKYFKLFITAKLVRISVSLVFSKVLVSE